ncbi:MAG: hypothetical protein ASARMPRED_003294 [Alectoria sarmentosa]|nr:MAG: hypothetical protein ASARMPRED_003294 [Alectoria sarmentosa]
MKVTTAPPKQKFLNDQDRREKAERTKVAMLTFEPNAVVRRDDFSNISNLSVALKESLIKHNDVHARLFVVEDLSRDVIEVLGARFDVDPLFFRGHISDYMWHNTRDPWVELPDLDIMSRNRSFLHVRYVQTRYFRSEDSLKRAKWEAGGFNVLRRVDKDGNWVPDADIPESDIGLVRSRTSFWIRPNKPGEKGVLGILLVDPTISEGFPIWGGYRNLVDCPSMAVLPVPKGPPRISMFEDVIHYTSALTPEEITSIAKDPRLLFKKTLMIVCAEWYTLVKYATTRITQLEWEIENPDLQSENGGLQITINKLHSWRRRFPIFRTLVLEVLEKVIERDKFVSSPENHVRDLQKDFKILLSNIEDLQLRADRIMAVVTAVMSIEESKKAFEQNRSLARLTWLAITFAPLSFVTSLFSMNSDLSTLGATFRIFFAVALPLTAFVLFLTRFANIGPELRWKQLLQGKRI